MDTSGTTAKNKLNKMLIYILSLTLVFCTAVSFTGCGSDTDSQISINIPDSDIVGNRVTAPVNTYYFTDNNLNIVDSDIDSVPDCYDGGASLKQIDGLKNKEVQEKINNKIRDTYTQMVNDLNPPPVRGSAIAVRDYLDEEGNPQPSQIMADCFIDANFENILSVKIWKYITYGNFNEDGDSITYADTKTLNFDLNTGEVLKLQDLFADNVDAFKYINRFTEEMLKTTDYESEEVFAYTDQFQIKLTSPFEGFREDVDFFINDYDGSINIVLNYKTPEFYIGTGPNEVTWITIPFCEEMGYTEKFDSEESLFEDEEVSYALIPHAVDETHKVRMQEVPDLSDFGDSVYYNKTLEYYDYQSGGFVNYAKKLYDNYKDVESFKKQVTEYRENYEGNISAGTYFNCRTESIGKFEMLTINEDMSAESINSKGEYITIYSDGSTRYMTFDAETSKVMSVDEIFVDGVDADEMLLKQMMAQKSKVDEWKGENEAPFVWSDKTEAYLRTMIKSINGFMLTNRGLILSFEDNAEAMAADYIGCAPEDLWNYAYLCTSEFEFRDFGCKNLTIFG